MATKVPPYRRQFDCYVDDNVAGGNKASTLSIYLYYYTCTHRNMGGLMKQQEIQLGCWVLPK